VRQRLQQEAFFMLGPCRKVTGAAQQKKKLPGKGCRDSRGPAARLGEGEMG
jgi:hypothetical protein